MSILGNKMVRFLVSAFLVGVLVSCASSVIEYQVDHGYLVDDSPGFYAYFTSLEENLPNDVELVVANEREISGRRTVFTPDEQDVYLVRAYVPTRKYVKPEILVRELNLELPAQTASTTGSIELGYFMKLLTNVGDPALFIDDESDGPTEDLYWIVPTERLLSMIPGAVKEVRAFAGEYGADQITGVAVFFQGTQGTWGRRGIYLTGRAWAFDDSQMGDP